VKLGYGAALHMMHSLCMRHLVIRYAPVVDRGLELHHPRDLIQVTELPPATSVGGVKSGSIVLRRYRCTEIVCSPQVL
jgi:hypothetical protein